MDADRYVREDPYARIRNMPWFTAPVVSDRSTEIFHLDGVAWHEAPVPSRFHHCWPQTRGYVDYLTLIERCACGAIRGSRFGWSERNTRKKDRR